MRIRLLALLAIFFAGSWSFADSANAQAACSPYVGGMCGQDTRIGLGAMLYRGLGGGGVFGNQAYYGQQMPMRPMPFMRRRMMMPMPTMPRRRIIIVNMPYQQPVYPAYQYQYQTVPYYGAGYGYGVPRGYGGLIGTVIRLVQTTIRQQVVHHEEHHDAAQAETSTRVVTKDPPADPRKDDPPNPVNAGYVPPGFTIVNE